MYKKYIWYNPSMWAHHSGREHILIINEPRKLAIPKDTRLGPGEHAVRTEGHAILVRLGKLVGSLTDAEGMCAHIYGSYPSILYHVLLIHAIFVRRLNVTNMSVKYNKHHISPYYSL